MASFEGIRKAHYLNVYILIGNLLAISIGLHNLIPYPYSITLIPLNNGDWNLMYFFYTLGCVLGCGLTILGKRYIQQKRTFLIIASMFFISELIHAFGNSVAVFCLARLTTGLSIGSTYVMLPTYFAEISTKFEKALYISSMFVSVQIGELIGTIVITECFGDDLMMVYSLICLTAPCLFVVLFTLFVPESPVQLLAQNRDTEAQEEIKKLRGTTFIKEEYEEMMFTQEESYKSLFSNRALHIIFGLASLQQLTGGGFFSRIYTYSLITLQNSLSELEGDYIYVSKAMQICSTILAQLILYKLGMKIALMLSAAVLCLCHVFLATYFDEYDWTDDILTLLGLNFIVIFYHFGIGPVPWLLMGQSFPPNMSAFATALIGCCPFIVSYAYNTLISEAELGFDVILWIGAVFSIAMLLYGWQIPETECKSTREIQYIFNNKIK